MSLSEVHLPDYKLRHELWNSISHGLGALFGIIVLILCLLKINQVGFIEGVPGSHPLSFESFVFKNISICIYAIGMMITYTISCIYHALAKNRGKKVLRILDHDTVYLLISGTYTPYCLISLRHATMWGCVPYCGPIIFTLCWILVILGIVFNSIHIEKFKVFSFIMYICAGWSIIFAIYDIYQIIGLNGFLLLLFGGIVYTLGSIIYGLGKSHSVWFHTIFHFFVLFGTILQFISIYLYVL